MRFILIICTISDLCLCRSFGELPLNTRLKYCGLSHWCKDRNDIFGNIKAQSGWTLTRRHCQLWVDTKPVPWSITISNKLSMVVCVCVWGGANLQNGVTCCDLPSWTFPMNRWATVISSWKCRHSLVGYPTRELTGKTERDRLGLKCSWMAPSDVYQLTSTSFFLVYVL